MNKEAPHGDRECLKLLLFFLIHAQIMADMGNMSLLSLYNLNKDNLFSSYNDVSFYTVIEQSNFDMMLKFYKWRKDIMSLSGHQY